MRVDVRKAEEENDGSARTVRSKTNSRFGAIVRDIIGMIKARGPEFFHLHIIVPSELANGFLHIRLFLGEFRMETNGDLVIILVLLNELSKNIFRSVTIREQTTADSERRNKIIHREELSWDALVRHTQCRRWSPTCLCWRETRWDSRSFRWEISSDIYHISRSRTCRSSQWFVEDRNNTDDWRSHYSREPRPEPSSRKDEYHNQRCFIVDDPHLVVVQAQIVSKPNQCQSFHDSSRKEVDYYWKLLFILYCPEGFNPHRYRLSKRHIKFRWSHSLSD